MMRVICVLTLIERVVLDKFSVVLKLGVSDASIALKGQLFFFYHSLVVCFMSLAR